MVRKYSRASAIQSIGVLAFAILTLFPLPAAAHRSETHSPGHVQSDDASGSAERERPWVLRIGSSLPCPAAPGKTCGCTGTACSTAKPPAAGRQLLGLALLSPGGSIAPP